VARIIYFSRDYTPHDYRFLTALSQTEHHVFFLRLEQRGHSLESRPLPSRVEIIPWIGGCAPARYSNASKLFIDLKRVIHQVKPDLIHAGPLQSVAFLVALTGYQPLVSASWGYDLLVDAQRNSLYTWITRYVLGHSAVMIGDCDTIRQSAIAYGMPGERIFTFPWGVDLQHFTPQENHPSQNEVFTILSTRSWEPIYGTDVIANAFVQAAQQCPGLRLVMLGNGSQAALLRRIFEQGRVLDRVNFPGQVSQADLPRYYQSADVYVSASHSDGTSISLLESIACARPVILPDIPGNREWITSGIQGWFYPDGDAQALVEAVLNAIDHRDQLLEMGRAARLLAEQRADWNKNFLELLNAYRLASTIYPKKTIPGNTSTTKS
jgi:glycosyltransferase involved in cell wall biosynthesis